ncbi:MAG: head-tail connector protein, partial [Cyanobacteria bacterium P01_A01_bin.17]
MDQTTEDTLIQLYVDAAKEHIGEYLNRPQYPSNSAIKAAALLIVGDLYENREAAGNRAMRENPAVCR